MSSIEVTPHKITEKDILKDSIRELIVGSISGAIGKIVEFPFDTVKVRLQYSQSLEKPLFKGTFDCILQTFQKEGVVGFYKGLISPLIGASAEVSCLFFSYRLSQDFILWYRNADSDKEQVGIVGKLGCGMFSGIITSFVLTPIELIKCKMQVDNLKLNNNKTSSSVFDFTKQIYKNDGLKGLWKGQTTTLIREAGGSCAWFGAYEYTLDTFKNYRTKGVASDTPYEHKAWELLIAGSMAGVGYNASLFPVDTVKNILQTSDGNEKSISSVTKHIWKTKGIKGFYSGIGVTLFKTIPASAIMFYAYEKLKKVVLV
ncbi:hypothetical protein CANARDRAFT_8048 [[Candida] arabinofermentans NRRL YB-2248]|uniref:Mitochondrial ornithine carrier protein n=1 Tax=[Candida] arabinofermentans NRRL YB-2248 TaxID=983967 RepID=A0A1E4SZM4_9ASCO|nr:hypothetical protein CANARDRAFT_8048 [[Candida] arabinofermentans NRRL YB-2248]